MSAEVTAPDEATNIQEILHGTTVNGKTSLWATTLETMGMSDGKTKKDDVKVEALEEGVHMMKGLVEAKQEEDDGEMWQFSLTPLKDFNATLHDLLAAFVKWSYKDDTNDYNISKAFRRLESYAAWMHENRAILSQELTEEAKKEAHAMWGPMQLTYSKDSTAVWWIDLAAVQSKNVKSFNHDLTMLYFVWACHFVMFQKTDGMILMENVHNVGMIHLFTMVPADLSAKLDRLTIGILPLKMNAIYLLHNPRWMSLLLTLMKPFLSKKMRQRMKIINKDVEKSITDIVGLEGIPKGFCGIEGFVERDEFAKIIQ